MSSKAWLLNNHAVTTLADTYVLMFWNSKLQLFIKILRVIVSPLDYLLRLMLQSMAFMQCDCHMSLQHVF